MSGGPGWKKASSRPAGEWCPTRFAPQAVIVSNRKLKSTTLGDVLIIAHYCDWLIR